jgi:CheY-like chemotaxis protein
MKVLVVDDEPMIREILVERLGMHGPEIVEAGNGVEGLALLASDTSINVVVSDIKMPVMDGISFIREARARGHQQPFIFFTAYASREMLDEVVRYGVHDFIDKTKMDGLDEAVMSAIDQQNNPAAPLDIEAELRRLEK